MSMLFRRLRLFNAQALSTGPSIMSLFDSGGKRKELVHLLRRGSSDSIKMYFSVFD